MKLADILGITSDHAVTEYPWGKALIDSLNHSVADHLKISYEVTGKEIVAALLERGSVHAIPLLNAEFDPLTGLVSQAPVVNEPVVLPIAPVLPTPTQPIVATPVIAPIVAVPVQATAPAAVNLDTQTWPAKKVIQYGAAIVLVIVVLGLAWNVWRGESTPAQERILEHTVNVLGDVAKTHVENSGKKTEAPAEAPKDPAPVPYEQPAQPANPNDPFAPQPPPP